MGFSEKPTGGGVAQISKRLTCTSGTVDELIGLIASGHTWTTGVFDGSRSDANFTSAELLALDIDGGMSVEAALGRCSEYSMMPAFGYQTFGSTPEKERFRLVWLLEKPIVDAETYRLAIKALLKIFPESDKACKDPARMWYGTNNGAFQVNPEAAYTLEDIRDRVGECAYVTDPAHAARTVKEFARLLDDRSTGGVYENLPKFGDKTVEPLYINRDLPPHHQDGGCLPDAHNGTSTLGGAVERNVDWKAVEYGCRLLREFIAGEDLPHDHTFGILTNALAARGGEKRFIEGMKARGEGANDRWTYWRVKCWEYGYFPMRCENFCPYAEICQHGTNLLHQGRFFRGSVRRVSSEEKKLVSAEESLAVFKQGFNEALGAQDDDIWLGIGEVGLGKTELYLDVKNCLICLPTHKLTGEVHERMIAFGNTDAIRVPKLPSISPEFDDEVERLHALGLHFQAREMVDSEILKAEQRRNWGQDPEAYDEELLEYARTDSLMRKGGTTCLVTHDKFLRSRLDTSVYNGVIIDEDILGKTIHSDSCAVSDLRQLLRIGGGDAFVESVLDSAPEILHPRPHVVSTVQSKLIDLLVENPDRFGTNVLSLFDCAFYTQTRVNNVDTICYCSEPTLPTGKVIVLSASANEEIYRRAFRNRGLHVWRAPQAEHAGEIIQICYPMSRHKLSGEKAEELCRAVESITGDIPVISFKALQRSELLKTMPNWYFGNLEGLDELAGQDIAIVGANHRPEVVYHMYAAALGHKPTRLESHLSYQTVVHNGYKFSFMTYDEDSFLRTIQMWLLESDLVQAVGRARTLRNDCIVHVFSDLVLKQATQVMTLDDAKTRSEQSAHSRQCSMQQEKPIPAWN